MISTLQVILASEWTDVAFSAVHSNGGVAMLFFIPVLLLGKYSLTQLLTAIFISRLPQVNYLVAEQESRLRRKAAKKHLSSQLVQYEMKMQGRARAGERQSTTQPEQPSLPLRRFATAVTTWQSKRFPVLSFDSMMITLILISTVLISLEPYAWPASFRLALEVADYIITACFVVELGTPRTFPGFKPVDTHCKSSPSQPAGRAAPYLARQFSR